LRPEIHTACRAFGSNWKAALGTSRRNLHGNKAATRMTISIELETAKWQNFDEVKAVE
jgi:hypothetical protein